MELEIAHVLGVSEYAAQQIFNITMNVGSLLSIATAIATIVSMELMLSLIQKTQLSSWYGLVFRQWVGVPSLLQ